MKNLCIPTPLTSSQSGPPMADYYWALDCVLFTKFLQFFIPLVPSVHYYKFYFLSSFLPSSFITQAAFIMHINVVSHLLLWPKLDMPPKRR